ncbi:MAG: ketol-acid reductoisomerase [Planctomycetota bacterium]
MRAAISNTAEFGAFEAGQQLVDDAMREKLRAILADIRGGAFGARFQSDAAAGFPWMRAKRTAADADAIEAAGRGVRTWMPWLDNRKDSR